jgi:hypothetical protein
MVCEIVGHKPDYLCLPGGAGGSGGGGGVMGTGGDGGSGEGPTLNYAIGTIENFATDRLYVGKMTLLVLRSVHNRTLITLLVTLNYGRRDAETRLLHGVAALSVGTSAYLASRQVDAPPAPVISQCANCYLSLNYLLNTAAPNYLLNIVVIILLILRKRVGDFP